MSKSIHWQMCFFCYRCNFMRWSGSLVSLNSRTNKNIINHHLFKLRVLNRTLFAIGLGGRRKLLQSIEESVVNAVEQPRATWISSSPQIMNEKFCAGNQLMHTHFSILHLPFRQSLVVDSGHTSELVARHDDPANVYSGRVSISEIHRQCKEF